jgi:tetratricopeptide (TPR) repeat protein
MENIPQFSGRKVLVVTNQQGTLDQIRSMLTLLHVEQIGSAANFELAIKALARSTFDIILCGDSLGEETTGQQFLEYLRSREIIAPSVIFVMISGGEAYAEIMRAAECTPDDYLLWPFTAVTLANRLGKQLARREAFSSIHEAMSKKDWKTAAIGCDNLARENKSFAAESRKLQGHVLLLAGDHAAAAEVYEDVLKHSHAGWARLGLAKALKAQGRIDEAANLLQSLIKDNRLMMGAYDALAETMSAADRANEELDVLKSAMEVSPGTAARARVLGKLAIESGDVALAENTARSLIDRYKRTPVGKTEDYLFAAKALAGNGKAEEALTIVKEAQSGPGKTLEPHTLAIAEAILHISLGRSEEAKAAIEKSPPPPLKDLNPATAAALSTVFYQTGDAAKGEEVLRHLVQNNPEDRAVLQSVQATLASVGKDNESKSLVDSSLREIIETNDDGVKLAYAGNLDQAIEKLTQAAERLPGNLQIVSNAALVLALALSKGTPVPNGMRTCLKYRKMVQDRDARHPKLQQIDQLLVKTRQKAA